MNLSTRRVCATAIAFNLGVASAFAAAAGDESIHQKILRGEPIRLSENRDTTARTVDAAWIREAIAKSLRVEIYNATITGTFDFRHVTVERPLLLDGCQIQERANFSEATFKDGVTFIRCVFQHGASFQNAAFQADVEMQDTEFRTAPANFLDANFQAGFDGSGLHFFSETRANFKRARFAKTAGFNNTVFEDEACFDNAHFAGAAQFRNAQFAEKADFYHVEVDGDASFDSDIDEEDSKLIRAARFQGEADFAGGKFLGSIAFQGAVFWKNLSFNGTDIAGNAYFCDDAENKIPGPTFKDDADFTNAHFGHSAYFTGTIFKGKAIFNSVKIDGYAAFWGKATSSGTENESNEEELSHAPKFEDTADFSSAVIGAQAQFAGAVFSKRVTFYGAQIGTGMFFNGVPEEETEGARFFGDADFNNLTVRGRACLQGVTFYQKASFNGSQLMDGIFCRAEPEANVEGTMFGGAADFIVAHFGGQAEFEGARFSGEATFEGAKFDGSAMFYSSPKLQTIFNGPISFNNAHIGGAAEFAGAIFKANATFYSVQIDGLADFHGQTEEDPPTIFEGRADFGQAHFGADAQFWNVVFQQEAGFHRVRCESLLNFENAIFRSDLSLLEATTRVLHFSSNGKIGNYPQAEQQFQGAVDMRGCLYDRIYEQVDDKTDWPSLVSHFNPYDRQPYTQLQRAFRSIGQDAVADRVYKVQQDKERELKWQQKDYSGWFGRWLYWAFLNYGVRPYQLIAISVLVIAVGTVLFSRPGAVEKEEPESGEGEITISKRDALGVSLRAFLPIDIIMGSRFVPSRKPLSFQFKILKYRGTIAMRPTTYATFFLQIAGWILVPLAIAAVTGILRVS